MKPLARHPEETLDVHLADIPLVGTVPVLPSESPGSFSSAYRAYVLFVVSLIGFLCAVDRVVISMFMAPIKLEFGLSDTELGVMTGVAFAVMGGIVAIPLARLADRGSRKWIIGASLLVWTLLTAATGIAANFVQLLGARLGVGVGEAGCIPATHSMLGDYYPREMRSRALGVHWAGTSLGLLGGLVGGGILAQTIGWRHGFVWLGLSGLLISLLFQLTVREPARVDEMKQLPLPTAGVIARLGDLRCFCLLVVAFSTTALAGSVVTWLPVYLGRAFVLTPIQIGLGLGLAIGVATAIGAVAGGQLGNRYSRHSKSWGARFSAANTVVVMPLFLGVFFAPNPTLAFTLLFLAFLVAGMIVGPIFAMLQDLVDPSVRATALAIVSLFGVLLGQGLGPVLVGFLSDHWQSATDSARGVRLGMTAVAMVNFLTIAAFWLLRRRIDVVLPRPDSPPHA
jgi:MFS family permease